MISKTHRCLVVGQAPPNVQSADPSHNVSGVLLYQPTWQRLMKLADVDEELFPLVFEAVNLNAQYKEGSGHVFDQEEGKKTAAAIFEELKGQSRHVLFLGHAVTKCFLPLLKLETSMNVGGLAVVKAYETLIRFSVIPHPSGLVKFWNSPENCKMVSGLLQLIKQETLSMELLRRMQGRDPSSLQVKQAIDIAKLTLSKPFKFNKVETPPAPKLNVSTSAWDEVRVLMRNLLKKAATDSSTGEGKLGLDQLLNLLKPQTALIAGGLVLAAGILLAKC